MRNRRTNIYVCETEERKVKLFKSSLSQSFVNDFNFYVLESVYYFKYQKGGTLSKIVNDLEQNDQGERCYRLMSLT